MMAILINIVSVITFLVFAYCSMKISRRFGRSGILGLLHILPFGNIIFWAIMAHTIIEPKREGVENAE
jgi:hypothetical protein